MRISHRLAIFTALCMAAATAMAGGHPDIISKTEVMEGGSSITLLKYWKEQGTVCQQYIKSVTTTVHGDSVKTEATVDEICDRPHLSGKGVIDVSPAKLVALEVVKAGDTEVHLPVLRQD